MRYHLQWNLFLDLEPPKDEELLEKIHDLIADASVEDEIMGLCHPANGCSEGTCGFDAEDSDDR